MVMVTRSTYRRTSESFESNGSNKTDKSQKNNIAPPPWCSLAKVQERKKTRKVASETWETRSLSPLRENICEYLRQDKRKFHKRKHSRACCKQTPAKNKGQAKTLIFLAFLFISLGILTSLWLTKSKLLPETYSLSKLLPNTNIISLLGLEQTSVEEECCSRMKYLVAELLRAEQALKSTLRLRKTMMLTSKTNKIDADVGYIEDMSVVRGKDTKQWGSRIALWGVIPLWRAAPPPDTVLSKRKPLPSDCWPFSGSSGELFFELPRRTQVRAISVEHIYPDTALSAPKHFILHGILTNGTWIKTIDAEYKHRGPAKQYFHLMHQDILMQIFVFDVLSNQGNPKYTCIYRIHFYERLVNKN